ncbi:poly(ADP-ribose) glycohydrolase 1-like isoform X2 [Momordica charantia]|uniref:poly(ADP-ribose) glycohydrolase n=1 Tax=Momordica charantia TaxID=3673 RepID=A0A6J1DM30_MOMCH|nr:poly(ADP-ribose) glycohydrolase 1-like isoform X2 [Momordica charantia]
MESREDLNSILPFLPLVLRSSNLFWPSQVVETLNSMAAGPDQSGLTTGDALFHSISAIRNSLSLTNQPLASSAHHGYSLFFDKLMPETESMQWFGEVIPALGNLLLRLPSLLENHYQIADQLDNKGSGNFQTGLRLLASQVAGTVYLSQELTGALLACAFFCLFPVIDRGSQNLPTINFDYLFAILYHRHSKMQENKIRCIIHYFRRICSNIPRGFVSFERKVLPLNNCSELFCYPKVNFWINSTIPLCQFKVKDSGLIEDQTFGALEVDFANEYIGGGALHSGCVQEEIRFMINPELIIGMLFLPAMADNEAIEIVGAERFSDYTGYASNFCFSGNHVDKQEMDSLGRRKTLITAIDALCSPGMRQYKLEFLLREINKAFCGFFDQSKCKQYERLFLGSEEDITDHKDPSRNNLVVHETSSDTRENYVGRSLTPEYSDHKDDIGIATGNWGCGAFGGDPHVKSIIQWLAASQALRPFILYYTFGIESMQSLEKVSEWILAHKWTVGDLWSMLVEYCSQISRGQTHAVFFDWLLPASSKTNLCCFS